MAENENDTTPSEGSSRRALLAKAAAAGAVVYAAPMVSSIPAYAAGGLPSFNSSSGTLCVWFSPNQNGGRGKWHADIAPFTGQTSDNTTVGSPSPSLTLSVSVGGSSRDVRFSGNPTNIPGNLGANLVTDTYTYYGGGSRIESLSSGCWIEVTNVVCNPQNGKSCDPTNDKAAPADWATGSSITPIDQAGAPNGDVGGGTFQDAYYHTGRTGEGEGLRCKLGILFKVRCI
jgi:hypothetical protein